MQTEEHDGIEIQWEIDAMKIIARSHVFPMIKWLDTSLHQSKKMQLKEDFLKTVYALYCKLKQPVVS